LLSTDPHQMIVSDLMHKRILLLSEK
jgi:hypothetical protein